MYFRVLIPVETSYTQTKKKKKGMQSISKNLTIGSEIKPPFLNMENYTIILNGRIGRRFVTKSRRLNKIAHEKLLKLSFRGDFKL